MNARLGLSEPITNTVLTIDDIKYIIKVMIDIKDGKGQIDDIDHLGNRRVRSVGELIEKPNSGLFGAYGKIYHRAHVFS